MDILIFITFVSLILVAGALLLFVFSVRQHDLDHTEELSLLPLDEEGHS